jgi:hypothetical protein
MPSFRQTKLRFDFASGESYLRQSFIEIVEKPASSEADGKCPDARLPKSRGMKRT